MKKEELSKIMRLANYRAQLLAKRKGGKQKDHLKEALHLVYKELDTMSHKEHSKQIIYGAYRAIKKHGRLTLKDISELALVQDKQSCKDIKSAVLTAIKNGIQVNGQLVDFSTYGVSLSLDRFYHDDSVAA